MPSTAVSRQAKTGRHVTQAAAVRAAKVAGGKDKGGSITVRTNTEDRRILDRLDSEGVTTTEAVRRGLRLVEQERWLEQARADALANRDENLNNEPDAW